MQHPHILSMTLIHNGDAIGAGEKDDYTWFHSFAFAAWFT